MLLIGPHCGVRKSAQHVNTFLEQREAAPKVVCAEPPIVCAGQHVLHEPHDVAGVADAQLQTDKRARAGDWQQVFLKVTQDGFIHLMALDSIEVHLH